MVRIAFVQSLLRTQQSVMQLFATLNTNASNKVVKEILNFKPDIIAFSTATATQKNEILRYKRIWIMN